MVRDYNGPMVKIRAFGSNQDISVTPEHPFFAVKRIYRRSNCSKHRAIQPKWIPANLLSKGDLLVIPKVIRKTSKNFEVIYSRRDEDPLTEDVSFGIKRSRNTHSRMIDCGDYYLTSINKISSSSFNGKVYNFEVEDDHSYCANGFAVHNCEAMAAGIACIGPEVGGTRQFMNPDNSFLVKYIGDEPISADMVRMNPIFEGLTWASHSWEDLAHIMRLVVSDKNKRLAVAEKGEEFIRKNLTFEIIGQRISSLIGVNHDDLRTAGSNEKR
jgi:hypothetical protein